MAKSYYSTVFEHTADAIWSIIRDFNNYPVWVDGAGESEIEGGKSGDAVGAVRCVLYGGRRIRQQLLSLSDIDRSMTYCFAGESPPPVQGLQATCGSRLWSTAGVPSSNGSPRSTAKPLYVTNASHSTARRLAAGSNRCGGISIGRLPKDCRSKG